MTEETEERIARALESIAASLVKLANPLVVIPGGLPVRPLYDTKTGIRMEAVGAVPPREGAAR